MKSAGHFFFFAAMASSLLLSVLLPAAERTDEPIIVYDLEYARNVDRDSPKEMRRSWDETFLIAALQGLANRDRPRIYIFYVRQHGISIDRYWFDLFRSPMPDGSPGWLQDREVRQIESLGELLVLLRGCYRGVVVYDERVPATSCVAASIAGADNLLPLRFDPDPDSLYSRLVTDPTGPRLPVKKRLLVKDGSPLFIGSGKIPGTEIESTGSAKADAYRWLIAHYIEKGKCDCENLAYYTDVFWLVSTNEIQDHTLTNYDYFIARRAPFVDLSPWDDEVPNDDPGQPMGTDARTLVEFLGAVSRQNRDKKMIHVGGFILWNTKYTDYGKTGGKHDPVSTEWKQVEILSNFNAWLDADALGLGAMANASFFAHFPLQKKYPFAKPTLADLKKRGLFDSNRRPVNKAYITLYVGDYDSAAWVYQIMPTIWSDPNRGSIPITWAFNPSLADRFAPGMDYLRRTATPNDLFVAGDSGAGYVNVMSLVPPRPYSGLSSALEIWGEHCREYYGQWDLSVTGFLIDGLAPEMNEEARRVYARFSPDGIVQHRYGQTGLTDGMPWLGMKYDLPNTPDAVDAAKIILNDVQLSDTPQFLVYRTILWSPTQIKKLCENLKADPEKGARIEVVDMYSFFHLLKSEQTAQPENIH